MASMNVVSIAGFIGIVWFLSFAQLGLIVWAFHRESFWDLAGFLYVMAALGPFSAVVAITIELIQHPVQLGLIWVRFRSINEILISVVLTNAICLPIFRWMGNRYYR